MKKYFVSSDIHSFYSIWMRALQKAGFDKDNEDHIIVVCGDLLDRGDESQEVIDFILSLPEERTLLVTGNHEDLMDDLVARGVPFSHDISNGTAKTLQQLTGHFWYFPLEEVKQKLTECGYYKVRSRMKDYIELDNYIFVHGWIPSNTEDWRNGNWEQARWENGIEQWHNGIKLADKTIVCGHWHCSWGWSHIRQQRKEFPPITRKDYAKSFEPFVDDGIIAIDACTAYSNIVNVYVIDK